MTDPFATLRDELRAAEQRLAAPPAPAKPRRLRGRRPLLVAITVLALGGSATAAVVSLTGGEPSPPLHGDTPPGTGIKHYSISLRPNLGAGEAGWCWTMHFGGGGALGCGSAPSADAAQIAGGDLMLGRPTRGAGTWHDIEFRILAPRVATVVLPGGRRITPRPDRGLPFGWTAVVAFAALRSQPPAPQVFRLLDAADHPIANSEVDTDRSPRGVAALPVVSVNARNPPDRPCAIHHRALPHLSAQDQKVVGVPIARGAAPVLGRAFRTCAAALYSYGRHRVTAAVLTDVAGPAFKAADLPLGAPNITARRIGPNWLVTYGPDAASRRTVLAALTVVAPR
ncbi:hypothetical protein [Conexibacter woesei]|uniref:hypothetical protein n=1 Tax=Conexibacter woesei TaxID=191495 RepID=UPI0003F672CC|nr:hypothetical protein [Conexibacter woesei]